MKIYSEGKNRTSTKICTHGSFPLYMYGILHHKPDDSPDWTKMLYALIPAVLRVMPSVSVNSCLLNV